ncbi:MAG: PilZ domain-containing protein [Desulfobacteraceae bacterium]|nr:PilZ domain-containing protein [Desulfobacteraceae bacterium]
MDYIRNSSGPDNAGIIKRDQTALLNRRLIDTEFEADSAPEQEKVLGKNKLVNILNLRHFKNKSLLVHFLHSETGRCRTAEAVPQPCFGKYLVCLWCKPTDFPAESEKYRPTGFSFSNGIELIHAETQLRAASTKGICFILPEKAEIKSSRMSVRHECTSVHASLLQNGVIFEGTLKDFNASAFCVVLSLSSDSPPFHWLNKEGALTLILDSEKGTFYSGQCRVLKMMQRENQDLLVLEPTSHTIQRFAPREYRSRRITISPSPDLNFKHPLTGRLVNLKAADISGAGISAVETKRAPVMLAGLIIPELTINFANAFSIKCKAQVTYTRSFKDENNNNNGYIRCGLAFLDMDPNDHVRLMAMIHQAENKHSYIGNPVDPEVLWDFFFETGFIYPRKYAFILPYKEEIKRTYEKLYSCQSALTRHFTWQNNGTIVAHLAMLRFYEKTWMIHHLAARTEKHVGAGTEMVDRLGAFAYETHRLASSQMSYLICYYRPENRFPSHFFGTAAEQIDNRDACSVDRFAYHHMRLRNVNGKLPRDWTLSGAEHEDLCMLSDFYKKHSGGRMLDALDLAADKSLYSKSDLSDQYHEIGLWRERRVFALRRDNKAKAVIMANVSDFALNLSDLTNSISIFVIDPDTPYEILKQTVSAMEQYYAAAKVPVLVYPLSYAEKNGPAYERIYCLWAMDMEYTDEFFKIYSSLK